MGDIGSAIGGGMNALASIYTADKYREGVYETNQMNYDIHQSDNAFNASEAEKARGFNWQSQIESQKFNASEADINRQFQSDEGEKARKWQEDMYQKYQSPEAMAETYERLGINPAAVLGGQTGNFNSTSFPTGDSASGSPVSGPSAVAGSAPTMLAPTQASNPVSAFIEAFNDIERTQSQVQGNKLIQYEQNVRNQNLQRQLLADLDKTIAEKEELLSRKDVNNQRKDNLKEELRGMKLNRKIIKLTMNDQIAKVHTEREKAEHETMIALYQETQEMIKTEYTPEIIMTQMNCDKQQALAALKAADAALQQAGNVKFDNETKRMAFKLEEKKYKEVGKKQAKAQAKAYAAQANRDNVDTEKTQLEVDNYYVDKIINITEFLLDQQTKRLNSLCNTVGMSFLKR